jgi:opine dehydrogenase
MQIAVLGAGNGGQALAGYLSMKGFSVNLYNRSEKRICQLKKNGGVQLSGLFKEFAPLNVITTNIRKAIEAVDLIMVVVPAHAHRFIAKICAPHLTKGQTIVLNPGRTGGALEFRNVLKEEGVDNHVHIAETQTFLFVSRVLGPHVAISGVKNVVPVAAIPSSDTTKVVETLKKIHNSFEEAKNVLETGLNNVGAIFHPSTMIFNIGRVESQDDFGYYVEGITPEIARFLERLDNERRMVARAFQVRTLSTSDWLRTVYSAKGRNLYELIQDNGKYRGVGSPGSLLHRYILEDIPTGLVPMASLGDLAGVETPVIDTVIGIASQFYRIDFWETGRTIESLKLKGMTGEQIINHVNGD